MTFFCKSVHDHGVKSKKLWRYIAPRCTTLASKASVAGMPTNSHSPYIPSCVASATPIGASGTPPSMRSSPMKSFDAHFPIRIMQSAVSSCVHPDSTPMPCRTAHRASFIHFFRSCKQKSKQAPSSNSHVKNHTSSAAITKPRRTRLVPCRSIRSWSKLLPRSHHCSRLRIEASLLIRTTAGAENWTHAVAFNDA